MSKPNPEGIYGLKCECGAEVSGPNLASVKEHMARHIQKAHKPKPKAKAQK